MQKISLSLRDRDVERLRDRVETDRCTSKSEAMRQLLDEYDETVEELGSLRTKYEDMREEYESRLDDKDKELERKEAQLDELRRQLQARGSVEDKVDELVEKKKSDRRGGLMARVWRLIFGG